MRNAHDLDGELPTVVSIPEPRTPEPRHDFEPSVDALDGIAPRVVRIANGARITELHLLISDAVLALEHDQPELALRILRGARADAMPKRGRGASLAVGQSGWDAPDNPPRS